ncbi:MAG: DUF1835 domain-containing protein [Lentisphaeria bacterium]|nr:DUF1835 domain-containing protein [Lentisphaeria bacterium]
MSKVLHITNGDCAVSTMQAAGIVGDFLPWRDVLHEGPVPAELDLEALSEERARFIAELGWGKLEDIRADFQNRDRMLESFQDYDELILWFEHDLYDQLQLIQILDWLKDQDQHTTTLSLICTDQYLGSLKPAEMLALLPSKEAITDEQLDLAHQAWQAFREPGLVEFKGLLELDTTALPYLESAIQRMLEELPNIKTGFSRTEEQVLNALSTATLTFGQLFQANQKAEEAMFMGDASFKVILGNMVKEQVIELVVGAVDKYKIMSTKYKDLANYDVDKWIGGTHLSPVSKYYYDPLSFEVIYKK